MNAHFKTAYLVKIKICGLFALLRLKIYSTIWLG